MEKLQLLGKYLFAAALAYLATAMILFVDEAARFRLAVDNLVQQVSSTGSNLDMPQLLLRVDKATEEIEQTRKLIPKVLAEVEKSRAVIPPLLAEIEQNRLLVPAILAEVQQTRAMLPGVLQESAALRQEIPGILQKSEKLVSEAQKVSADMGTGAVHGTVKGVITAPIKIIETGIETVGDGIKAVGDGAEKLLRQPDNGAQKKN